MFAGTSHGTELKRFFRLPLTRAALAVMLLIPLLYGAMYVWAFWDPTSRMDQMPIALVNEDIPATVDGEVLTAGQQTVDKLIEEKPFNWKVVDAAEAANGVEHGRYYFSVTIPADYSSSIASLKSNSPHQAHIQVNYDDSNSFLASTLGQTAMLKVKEAVNSTSGQQAVEKLLVSMGDIRNGLGSGADGAFLLSDGLKKGSDGVEKLQVGAAELNRGTQALAEGGQKLTAGTATAVTQTAPLAGGVEKLNTGAEQLAAGLDALKQKTPTLVGGVHQLAVGSSQSSAGSAQLAKLQATFTDALSRAGGGVSQLAGGTGALNDIMGALNKLNDPSGGAPALASGADQLAGGINTLAGGLGTLATGMDRISSGATGFASGAERYADGATQLSGAVSGLSQQVGQLTAGSDQVAQGATQASSGAQKVNDGLGQLSASLADGGQLSAALSSTDPTVRDQALTQLRGLVQQAKDGSGALVDGTAKLSDGSGQVTAGLHQLSDKLGPSATQLSGSAQTLKGAAQDLSGGAGSLATGVNDFKAGTKDAATLVAGSQKLAQSTHALADGVSTLTSKATAPTALPALVGGLNQLNDGFNNPDPRQGLIAGAKALSAGTTQLSDAGLQLAAGANQLDSGTGQLADGIGKLADGAQGLSSGTGQLNEKIPGLVDGVKQLDSGASAIADGSTKLAAGTNALAEKVPELSAGLTTAQDGSSELGSKLRDGQSQIPDDSTSLQQSRSTAVQTPVDLKESWVDKADSWGEGFAPFFIPLALWVGALITWLLLRPLQTRPLMTNVSGFRTAWGSLNSALVLAIGQVLIMLAVMHWAIGLDIDNVSATIGLALLTAFSFMSLQQFFQIAFGTAPGKVIVIALLMVQLASAGGTYPIETEPGFLRAINPYMPMTYVVQGLRESITGGLDTKFWTSIVVLASIFIISLVGSSFMAARKKMWSMSRLHPALSL